MQDKDFCFPIHSIDDVKGAKLASSFETSQTNSKYNFNQEKKRENIYLVFTEAIVIKFDLVHVLISVIKQVQNICSMAYIK